jgi:WD40 repeat protein
MAGVTQVSVGDGGRYIALGGESGVGVFEASSGKLRFRPPQIKEASAIDLTPDGRYLAISNNKTLQVFDVSNGTLNWTNTDFEQPISTVAFSRDGKHLAVGGRIQSCECSARKEETR